MNCPHCKRQLYSRMHAKCGHCGGLLPEEFRLPDHEIAAIRKEFAESSWRRAVAREKEAKERDEEKRKGDDGGWFIIQ